MKYGLVLKTLRKNRSADAGSEDTGSEDTGSEEADVEGARKGRKYRYAGFEMKYGIIGLLGVFFIEEDKAE